MVDLDTHLLLHVLCGAGTQHGCSGCATSETVMELYPGVSRGCSPALLREHWATFSSHHEKTPWQNLGIELGKEGSILAHSPSWRASPGGRSVRQPVTVTHSQETEREDFSPQLLVSLLFSRPLAPGPWSLDRPPTLGWIFPPPNLIKVTTHSHA